MPSPRLAAAAAPALCASVLALGPAASARHAPAAPHRAAVTRVSVVAATPSEFRFKLSKRVVRRGTVVFSIRNRGALPHDFKVHGKKTKLLSPGKSATLRVVFKKAGRYPYLCTVSGHAAAGMKGVLRVR
ncbi:MAG TPA: plastocyanin/azurin family copper-binding protein [Gaiellaceae bacterium]|nr:plastocyanin/azurin family copper-binding protein [Gaiellaceae bacterium]